MSNFQSLNLDPKLLEALADKDYKEPTPIQKQAIPPILEQRDLIGIAQTGTGKTAAFSLPVLQNLTKSNVKVKPNSIRCLILTPTRELASQIAKNIEVYGAKLHLRHAVIFGGVNEKPQIGKLKKGLDIAIATPGRLLDLMSQGHVRYAQLEIFILDEADRMLDMGFIHDIKKIIAKLPKERQTLFFSATMPEEISKLAQSILNDPVKVEVTPPATTVEKIDQKIYLVAKSNKSALLKTMLKNDKDSRILVFLRTKHGSNRLADFLERHGIEAGVIHGNKSQSAREKALENFHSGKTNVLIATDIAARGIDVPGITHVVNFDMPKDPESYVHRIGRTARAGKNGVAISFCGPDEGKSLKAVQKTIDYQIPIDRTHPYHGVEGAKEADPTTDRRPAINGRNSRNSRSSVNEREARSNKPTERRSNSGGRFNSESSESNSRVRSSGRPNDRFNKGRPARSNDEERGNSDFGKEGSERPEPNYNSRTRSSGGSRDGFNERRSARGGRESQSQTRRTSHFESREGNSDRERPEVDGNRERPQRSSSFKGKPLPKQGELVDRSQSSFSGKKPFKKKPLGKGGSSGGMKFLGRNRSQKKKGF